MLTTIEKTISTGLKHPKWRTFSFAWEIHPPHQVEDEGDVGVVGLLSTAALGFSLSGDGIFFCCGVVVSFCSIFPQNLLGLSRYIIDSRLRLIVLWRDIRAFNNLNRWKTIENTDFAKNFFIVVLRKNIKERACLFHVCKHFSTYLTVRLTCRCPLNLHELLHRPYCDGATVLNFYQ